MGIACEEASREASLEAPKKAHTNAAESFHKEANEGETREVLTSEVSESVLLPSTTTPFEAELATFADSHKNLHIGPLQREAPPKAAASTAESHEDGMRVP